MDERNKDIKNILQPEERILWSGRPSLKRVLTMAEFALLSIELIFLFLMMAMAINSNSYFVLFIAMFILFFDLWVRFIYRYKQRRKLLYVVTSSRIIFLFQDEINVKKYEEIKAYEIEMKLKWGRTGTIYLSDFPKYYFSGRIVAEVDREHTDILADIEDVEEVYTLIKSKLATLD